MGSKLIRDHCRLDTVSLQLLKTAMERLNLSARAYDRILKVSRTIADLEGSEKYRPKPHRRGHPIPQSGSRRLARLTKNISYPLSIKLDVSLRAGCTLYLSRLAALRRKRMPLPSLTRIRINRHFTTRFWFGFQNQFVFLES
jgi:hypothetical protein